MVLAEIAVILVAAKLAGERASHWGQPPVLGQLVFSVAVVLTGSEDTNVPLLLGSLALFFAISVLVAPRAISWVMRQTDNLRGAEAAVAVALALALVYGFAAASAGLAAITGA